MGVRPAGSRPVRVGMIGLGCAKNLVDGEVMLGYLKERGLSITADIEKAEVVIINTCGFVVDAKQESIQAILEVAGRKARGEIRRLVVAGCMVQRYAAELAAEIPEIDAFVGLDELQRVAEVVLGNESTKSAPEQRAASALYDHHSPRLVSTGPGFAYLKIADGCDNPCSFCHIPRMRGGFRSRSVDSLVLEAQRLEEIGVQELVLVAQDTTRFGEDLGLGRHGLRALLQALLQHTGIPWLRFMYAYPPTLDEGLFELMARENRILPYLDLPLQHASRKVLKAMSRGGDGKKYRALIERARSEVPGLVVRTTFIVGFPGEGEEEFAELQSFVEDMRFDHLGVFTYSWQEENPGAHLGDSVPERIKIRRQRSIMKQQERISREKYRALRGSTALAIVDGPSPESEFLLQGRLARQAPEVDGRALFSDGTAQEGDIVRVKIERTYAFDVVCKIEGVVHKAPTSKSEYLPTLRDRSKHLASTR